MSRVVAEAAASILGARSTRRSFLVRMAVAGSALTVAPLRYILQPGTAYAAVCGPDSDVRVRVHGHVLHDLGHQQQQLSARDVRRWLVEGGQLRTVLWKRGSLLHRLQRGVRADVRLPLRQRELRRTQGLLQPVPVRPVPSGDRVLRADRLPGGHL